MSVRRKSLTFDVLHDHAQVSACLKGTVHADHERVLGEGQDVPLYKRLLDLVPQHQVLLVDLLHRKALIGLFVPHQIDGAGRRRENEYVCSHRLTSEMNTNDVIRHMLLNIYIFKKINKLYNFDGLIMTY